MFLHDYFKNARTSQCYVRVPKNSCDSQAGPRDPAPVEVHSNLFECISTGAVRVAWGRGAPWGSTGAAAEILRQEAAPGISPRLRMGLAPLTAACASVP